MTAPQELRTARLLLRSFERGDIPAIVRLAGTREIAATTLHIPHPYDNAEAEDFLARMDAECRQGSAAVFAVAISSSGELCGACGLHVASVQQRAELGYRRSVLGTGLCDRGSARGGGVWLQYARAAPDSRFPFCGECRLGTRPG